MKRVYIFALVLVVFSYSPVSATIINIPDDYPTIQQGIDASTDGDTVLVQPGTYVENINFNGHNIVLGSLFLTTGDTEYISTTIIDGSGSGSVVYFNSSEESTTIITGFTIQNGSPYYGGGIRCDNSSPTIIYNTITGNSAILGGGILCWVSNPTINNNTISGNSASFWGGGIFCRNSNSMITNNTISENSADDSGGGIYCFESNPFIINNTISGNWAEIAGGGIYCELVSNPVITNTIFWADSAQYNQEIWADTSSALTITYCNIQDTLWPGEDNISVDPLFRDPDNGDFHLMSTACGDPYDSPCIDAGHPDILDSLLDCSWGLGELRSDMGAYGGGDSTMVGIDDDKEPEVPIRFDLSQNYPNPFNAMTVIQYNLPEPSDVRIEIFDILGRRVQILLAEKQPAGYHQVIWDAENQSSGMYFYRIEAGEYSDTKKMVLLK